MPNSLTTRNLELTPSIREYVEKKVDRLRKIFENIQKIEIILSADKLKRGEADLIVEASLGTMKCAAKDETPLAAFDIAMEKMERQLQRHKARVVGNKKHLRSNPRRQDGFSSIPEVQLPEIVTTDDEMPTIHSIQPEHLTPQEALGRFVRANYDVLVFRDLDSKNVSVIYRDQDGENRLLEVMG